MSQDIGLKNSSTCEICTQINKGRTHMTGKECSGIWCHKIATIQISHCSTKNGGLEKGEHFNYYCDSHYYINQKAMPYPHFITDIGLIIKEGYFV